MLGDVTIFEGKGRRTTEINTIFSMGNGNQIIFVSPPPPKLRPANKSRKTGFWYFFPISAVYTGWAKSYYTLV